MVSRRASRPAPPPPRFRNSPRNGTATDPGPDRAATPDATEGPPGEPRRRGGQRDVRAPDPASAPMATTEPVVASANLLGGTARTVSPYLPAIEVTVTRNPGSITMRADRFAPNQRPGPFRVAPGPVVRTRSRKSPRPSGHRGHRR
jgi:hypothetical protein